MARIVNSTPGSVIKVPETKYLIKKCIEPKFKLETHAKCRRCLNYYGNTCSEIRCNSCDIPIKATNSDYFIYIPVKEQLEHPEWKK